MLAQKESPPIRSQEKYFARRLMPVICGQDDRLGLPFCKLQRSHLCSVDLCTILASHLCLFTSLLLKGTTLSHLSLSLSMPLFFQGDFGFCSPCHMLCVALSFAGENDIMFPEFLLSPYMAADSCAWEESRQYLALSAPRTPHLSIRKSLRESHNLESLRELPEEWKDQILRLISNFMLCA